MIFIKSCLLLHLINGILSQLDDYTSTVSPAISTFPPISTVTYLNNDIDEKAKTYSITSNDPSDSKKDTSSLPASSVSSLSASSLESSLSPTSRSSYDSEESTIIKPNATKINWDEIQKIWIKILEDNLVTSKWGNLESGMKKGIRDILRNIFPRIVSMSTETKVSGNCSAGILKWLLSMRELTDWSIKMIDATGKPVSGMLEGSVSMFGNYHECIAIRVFDDEFDDDDEIVDDFELNETNHEKKSVEKKEFFRGKYCILQFKPWLPQKPHFYGMDTKLKALKRPDSDTTVFKDISNLAVFLNFISLRFDICVPSLCTLEDMQKVVGFLAKAADIRGKVLRCEIEEDTINLLSPAQVLSITILIFLLLIFGFLTVIGFCFLGTSRIDSTFKYFLSLTWITSFTEICGYEAYMIKRQLGAVYGLRTILMIYIILTHSLVEVNYGFFRDVLWIRDMALSWPAQLLTKSAYQFDAFILISAFSMSYLISNKSAFYGITYILRKYLRMLPSVLIATGLIVLLPFTRKYFRGGPTWGDFINPAVETCEKNGLVNLVFMQNFLDPSKICLRQTWILCVELQLALICLPFFSIIRKCSKFSYILSMLTLVVIGFIVNVIIVHKNSLPPALLWTLPDPEQRNYYYRIYYFKPWTHLSVFAIGLIAGHLCANRDRKAVQLSHYRHFVIRIIGWIFSSMILLFIIFAYYDWVRGEFPSPLYSSLFDASHRILLSLAMSFIMYSLTADSEDGLSLKVIEFLKSRPLVILGHLTLIAYLIHPIVQLIFLGTQQAQLFSGPLILLYSLFGNVALTFLMSFVIAIFLEIPIAMALKSRRHSSKQAKEFIINNDNNNHKPPPIGVTNLGADIELSKNS